MAKPRVLILAPDLPWPAYGGGRLRMSSVVSAISSSADVRMACIADSIGSDTQKWAASSGVAIFNHERRKLSPLAVQCGRLASIVRGSNLVHYRDEQRFFDRHVRDFGPDLVWLETLYLIRYVAGLVKELPVVVDYWGTSQGAEREYVSAKGISRIWQWVRWRISRAGEVRYAPKMSGVVTISDLDNRYFREDLGCGSVWTVSAAVPSASMHRPVCSEEGLMTFTGDMSYRPNVDAALWFVTEVLPIIRKAVPDARMRLVGGNPCHEIRKLADVDGVEVTGFVDDMVEEVAKCSIYVLPMRLGSGVRTKLLDAFALSKAIVTTDTGAEGLALENGRNCLVANTAEQFASSCIGLLQDSQLRERIGALAGKLATDIYTEERVEEAVRSILDNLLAAAKGGTS